MADLRASQAENQHLRNEINRLKGEQGTPKIKANTPPPSRQNHSSRNRNGVSPRRGPRGARRPTFPSTGKR